MRQVFKLLSGLDPKLRDTAALSFYLVGLAAMVTTPEEAVATSMVAD